VADGGGNLSQTTAIRDGRTTLPHYERQR